MYQSFDPRTYTLFHPKLTVQWKKHAPWTSHISFFRHVITLQLILRKKRGHVMEVWWLIGSMGTVNLGVNGEQCFARDKTANDSIVVNVSLLTRHFCSG